MTAPVVPVAAEPIASQPVPPEEERPAPPTPAALFLIFLKITLQSFGAALPWLHRDVVERRRWLSEAEFIELFGLCQILPGGNAVNMAIMIGVRFRGAVGAIASFAGLLIPPLLIGIATALLYGSFATNPLVHGALGGLAAAGAGLILATGLKLAKQFRRSVPDLAFAAAAFSGIVLLHLPLAWVLLGLIALGILYHMLRRRIA